MLMYNAKVITFGDIRLCGCSFFSEGVINYLFD